MLQLPLLAAKVIQLIRGISNYQSCKQARVISQEDGKKYADDIGALYFEVSARSGDNINQLFQSLVSQLLGGTVDTNNVLQSPIGNNQTPDPSKCNVEE